jgi:hypothetical protein
MDNVVQKFDANWKNILIGSAIGLILLFVFPTVLGSITAIILATIYVGFAVGGNYTNGAFNGVITGIIIAIIQGLTVFYSTKAIDISNVPFILLSLGIIYGISGVLGSIIGIRIDKW